jgi:hypothetical protein
MQERKSIADSKEKLAIKKLLEENKSSEVKIRELLAEKNQDIEKCQKRALQIFTSAQELIAQQMALSQTHKQHMEHIVKHIVIEQNKVLNNNSLLKKMLYRDYIEPDPESLFYKFEQFFFRII